MNAQDDRIETLLELRAALASCRRCSLYRKATQVVPGEGAVLAPIMLVGEQPGNDEDLAGHPFVGPAGRILNAALHEAGLDRKKLFVTNAVKHFKFEPRGKRRLHKRPNVDEIELCAKWNELERAIVRPKVIVALGTTAARSLMGKSVTISQLRGQVTNSPSGALIVTIHPSFLLRLPEERDKKREFRNFVRDLELCRRYADEA